VSGATEQLAVLEAEIAAREAERQRLSPSAIKALREQAAAEAQEKLAADAAALDRATAAAGTFEPLRDKAIEAQIAFTEAAEKAAAAKYELDRAYASASKRGIEMAPKPVSAAVLATRDRELRNQLTQLPSVLGLDW
jgi:hypothetical protein